MILCPICQFRNPDANERCFRCSALLKRDDDAMKEAAAAVNRKTRMRRFTSPITSPLDYLAHRPWLARLSQVPDDGAYRFPFTAGLLSLIPGAGHWYAGIPWRGALIFILWLPLFITAVVSIRAPWSNYLLFAMLIFWLFVWSDSVAMAARRNGDSWIFRKTLALVFAAMILVGVTISTVQYLGLGFIQLVRVGSNALYPDITTGDRLLFSSVPFWFRDPKVGEIVTYDPVRMEVLEDRNVYSINIRQYIQRILAGPGDNIEKRGDTYYLNGQQIDARKLFLGQPGPLPDFNLTVPEDTYFIPVTGIPGDALAGLLGAGSITRVGQPGFTFVDWPNFALVNEQEIRGKGIVVLSPPENRRWLTE